MDEHNERDTVGDTANGCRVAVVAGSDEVLRLPSPPTPSSVGVGASFGFDAAVAAAMVDQVSGITAAVRPTTGRGTMSGLLWLLTFSALWCVHSLTPLRPSTGFVVSMAVMVPVGFWWPKRRVLRSGRDASRTSAH